MSVGKVDFPKLSNILAVIGAELSEHHVVHTCLYVLYVSWDGHKLSNILAVIGAELSGHQREASQK